MVLKLLKSHLDRWRYAPVADAPLEGYIPESEKVKPAYKGKSLAIYAAGAIGSLVLIVIFVVEILSQPTAVLHRSCENPPVRREWRSLTSDEKAEFTQAVLCLAKTPSQWQGGNGTIYDDFAILHGGIGSWCHRSACFLPWHRYTLFVFENILRQQCGFQGQIPYWDWTLDWMDLANSSIFNSTTGFGGDGDPRGPEIVGGGRCVTDGPFAGLRPILYNHTYTRHCLARGFQDGEVSGRISGEYYRPESIGAILRKESYRDFVRAVEIYLHNPLHQGIKGDFLAMTAANDPLFYVHHAQLDRLWWRWQRENPGVRFEEYEGQHMYNSTGNATLEDALMYGGFTGDVPVARVMDTTAGPLCYTY